LVCLFDMFKEEFVLPRFQCRLFKEFMGSSAHCTILEVCAARQIWLLTRPQSRPVLAVAICVVFGGFKN
jgi:hypothetical protein